MQQMQQVQCKYSLYNFENVLLAFQLFFNCSIVYCMLYSCWIKEPLVLYGVNLSYFTIIFLFNLGILITVSRQIFKLRRVGNRNGKMPIWKDVGTVLGLMCLLGTTWGLAFFSSGYTNYVILYLFCILNSMQGMFSQGTRVTENI